MTKKTERLKIGDLVELRAASAKLQKFYRLKSCIGVILDIKESSKTLKDGSRRNVATVFWNRQNGRVELKLYLHRLKKVK